METLDMKPLSESRNIAFTENDMALHFKRILERKSLLPGIESFSRIVEEQNCYQGCPDFIALSQQKNKARFSIPKNLFAVSCEILSVLKPVASRSLQYLMKHTRCSGYLLNKTLCLLEDNNLVKKANTETYVLGDVFSSQNNELTVFELKLRGHRKAIFQAQQSKNYACRSLIVVPPGQTRCYDKYSVLMNRWGIGLAAFDPVTGNFNVVRKARKTKPLSNYDYMNTLLRILCD